MIRWVTGWFISLENNCTSLRSFQLSHFYSTRREESLEEKMALLFKDTRDQRHEQNTLSSRLEDNSSTPPLPDRGLYSAGVLPSNQRITVSG